MASEYFKGVLNNLLTGDNKQLVGKGLGKKAGDEEAALQMENKQDKSKDNLEKTIGEEERVNPYGGGLYRMGGGIGPMDLGGEDNTDMSSNMTKAYMKKKGY